MSECKPPVLMHEAMRESRLRAGISQSELAQRAGTFQALISRYELGQAMPSLFTAIDLSRALGLSLEEYLGLRELQRDIPSLDEVRAYCAEKGYVVDPARFFTHYEAVGWMYGIRPVRDWRKLVDKWEVEDRAGRKPVSGVCESAAEPDSREWPIVYDA